MRPSEEIRPSFEVTLDRPVDEVLDQLRTYLDRQEFGCRGWVCAPDAELEVQAGTKCFWSPRLAVNAIDDEDGRCRLHCRFQPEPNVWTMYMAAWGVLAVLGSCSICWVCAHLILGHGIVIPAACVGTSLVLAIVLLVVARVGRALGADQMELLRRSLYAAVGRRSPSEAVSPGGRAAELISP